MKILDSFFETLAQKFYKETKLSDIIWTMCSTSIIFQDIFLEYCFDKKISVDGQIKREHYKNGSKPDFYFTDINGGEYLIENKINDRGDHFEQYANEFPNATKSFIANYKEQPDQHKYWHIKNWKEFIRFLEEKITKNIKSEEIDLIQSFILYLRSLIYYWEAKTMNFTNLSSLDSFYKIISELIEQKGLQDYNIPSAITSTRYGKYFYYTNKDGKNVYIWLGLYLPEESGVYIYFTKYQDESWLPITEQNKIKNIKSGKYFDFTDVEYGDFFIHLKDEYYKKLCENIDVNEQKEILNNFLTEILDILEYKATAHN